MTTRDHFGCDCFFTSKKPTMVMNRMELVKKIILVNAESTRFIQTPIMGAKYQQLMHCQSYDLNVVTYESRGRGGSQRDPSQVF